MAAAAAEARRLEGAWEGSAPITVRPLRHPTTSSQRRPSMPRESENVSAGAGLRAGVMLRGQTLTFAKDRNDYNYIIIYIVMLLSLH